MWNLFHLIVLWNIDYLLNSIWGTLDEIGYIIKIKFKFLLFS